MIRLLLCAWMLLVGSLALAATPTQEATAQMLRERFEHLPAARLGVTRIHNLQLDQAVTLFYARRDFAPAWLSAKNVAALLQEITDLYQDGLNPEDYRYTALQNLYVRVQSAPEDAKLRTEFDIAATSAYLRALSHLFRGKINPRTLSPHWNFAHNDMDSDQAMLLMSDAVNTDKIAWAFDFARPRQPLYQQMQAGLAHLRGLAAQGGWPTLDTKTTLKPGMTDPVVTVLRKRLQIEGYLPAEQATGEAHNKYDEALTLAVQRFQREYFLDDDGEIGPATRSALNTPVQERIDQIRVNLERGRWTLQALNGTFVLVDVAGYRVSYYKDGKPIWQAAVQVGKPYRATPIFRSEITHVTFNPTWTIPPTILRKDVLPKLRKSLDYLRDNKVRVYDTRGRELDPTGIDWNSPGPVVLRQDAGPDGALGQVAIRFPNSHAVYLHDTPHKELFGKGQRAFSSGCIRVERPLELVELLFNDPDNWNRAGIEAAIATARTHNVNLPEPVPILLLYWTVDVRDDGHITFKPDIYQNDAPLLKALNRPIAG